MKSNRTSPWRVLGTVVISGAVWAAACGSRTPLYVDPSGDDDGTGDDVDASVLSEGGADRSIDARDGTDVSLGSVDAIDAVDRIDQPDRIDVADRFDVADREGVVDRFDVADTRDTADAPCFAVSREGKGIPIDFVFLVDKSNSMAGDAGMQSRWSAMANALNTFVQSPSSAGLGAGVTFFPRSSNPAGNAALCAVSDYATPDVPIGLLPGVAPSIATALAAQRLGAGTPTTPALQATLAYAKNAKIANPTRDVAVVLVSDGDPTQCSSTLANSTAAISAYANGSPPVRTYVLGIGPSVSNLNAFALAGGTAPAHLIETGGEAELVAAFNAIRDNAITCEYDVPTMDGGVLDYAQVSLQVRIGVNGSLMMLTRIADAAACTQGGGGWYYDQPVPPGNPPPQKITLCPATCSSLMTTPGSHLDAIIGCKSSTP